jgi:hypothetical protein
VSVPDPDGLVNVWRAPSASMKVTAPVVALTASRRPWLKRQPRPNPASSGSWAL